MATTTLTCSSWSPGRLRVTYSASNGTVTITEMAGCRTDSWSSSWTTHKSVTATVGGTSKSVSLSSYVNFGASSSYKTWGATDTSWTGRTGTSVSISVKMPTGSPAYSGVTFSGSLSMSWSTYTITYNANGGTGAPANQTKTYGTNLTLSTTVPTRESIVSEGYITHYTFKGWSTSATATEATYTAGGSYTTNAAATLYAVWEEVIEFTGAPPDKPSFSILSVADGSIRLGLIEPDEYFNAEFGGWDVNVLDGTYKLSGNNLTVSWDGNKTVLAYVKVVDSKGFKSEAIEIVCNVRKVGFCVYDKGRWKRMSPYIYRDGEYKRLNEAVYSEEDAAWLKYYCRGKEITYLTDESGDIYTDETGVVLLI